MKSEGITMDVNFSIFFAASSYLLKALSVDEIMGCGTDTGGGGAGSGGGGCDGGGGGTGFAGTGVGSGGVGPFVSGGDLLRTSPPTPLL